jgi:hypothetical protein
LRHGRTNSLLRSIVLLCPLWAATPVFAETISELASSGYEVLWEGYSPVTTCVHDQDTYEFGPFIFVCDQYTYEYPYHYGTTTLLARVVDVNGQRIVTSFICLEDEDECIQGSVFRK